MDKTTIHDKVSDIICKMSRGTCVVKFNVMLNKKDKDGKAQGYYQEYEYPSNKYIDVNRARTIRRDFYYNVTITYNETFVTIRPENMIICRRRLQQCTDWFLHEKYKDLFTISNGLLIINPRMRIKPINIPMAYGDSIEFIPSVITEPDESVTQGVIMKINDKEEFPITIDDLFTFYYEMMSLNMYQSANTIVSSMKIRQDRFSVNQIGFDKPLPNREPKPYASAVNIKTSKKTSLNDL